MSHDTHDDDDVDDERGEGAVVRGTDRVIKSRDSSTKTKKVAPFTNTSPKPMSAAPQEGAAAGPGRGSRGLERTERDKSIDKYLLLQRGFTFTCQQVLATLAPRCCPHLFPRLRPRPPPPGTLKLFLEGQTNLGAGLKSSRQVRGIVNTIRNK